MQSAYPKTDKLRIVITGASGNLGGKLRRYLASKACYELVCLDLKANGADNIIEADLSQYDSSWANLLSDADAIVHLAADSRLHAPWASLQASNVDATINVYQAALVSRAKRIIFASSTATMSGHMKQAAIIDSSMPTWPENDYGVTKIMGESLGRIYAERHGLSVICLRIGWAAPGNNQPDLNNSQYENLRMWLSNRDFLQGIEKAIHAESIGYAILNLMSANTGMPWDINETARVIGYQPMDGITPVHPTASRIYWQRAQRLLGRIRGYRNNT